MHPIGMVNDVKSTTVTEKVLLIVEVNVPPLTLLIVTVSPVVKPCACKVVTLQGLLTNFAVVRLVGITVQLDGTENWVGLITVAVKRPLMATVNVPPVTPLMVTVLPVVKPCGEAEVMTVGLPRSIEEIAVEAPTIPNVAVTP